MLTVRDLHAYYGKSHILQGVHLEVRAGEIVSLLGRNGVGRSTTCKAIMGLVQPVGELFATFDPRDPPNPIRAAWRQSRDGHARARPAHHEREQHVALARVAHVARGQLPALRLVELGVAGRGGGRGALTEDLPRPRAVDRLAVHGRPGADLRQQPLLLEPGRDELRPHRQPLAAPRRQADCR